MIELIPETYVAPLDLLAIFGRVAPLHVDLGCGDGSFLCELARRYPDHNFLGIERLVGRVAKTCQKASALRHQRRRIVKLDFLDAIHRALADDGFFRIATDQLDYFEQIRGTARNHSGFALVDASVSPAWTDLPLTKFERRFSALGLPIHRLALRKISPVR